MSSNQTAQSIPQKVQAQYEELPYPHRDPANEKTQLLTPFNNCLDFLNQACFGGARDFSKPIRVLIAGGGTGDAAVFWAENLRDNPQAEITYLDFSTASRKVAEERLKNRGLHERINWLTDSILNIPKLNLDKFDYINCSGVLHHLENPNAGLAALAGVLADDGVIDLMVYGTHGRYGIYPMQDIMRTINKGVDDKMQKIVNTFDTLKSLPQGNYFLPNYQLIKNINNPAEIYDLFLHDQDRSYTIPECYEFAASAGLNITEFFMGLGFGKKSDFLPSRYIKDEKLLEKITKLPLSKQHAIAEIMHSRMTKHSFYCMKKQPAKIEFGLDVIPSFSVIFPANYGETLAHEIIKVPDILSMGIMNMNIPIFKTPNAAEILRNIDGKKTVGEIIAGKDFYDEFKAMYENLNDHYLLFLRQKNIPQYKTVEEMQKRVEN